LFFFYAGERQEGREDKNKKKADGSPLGCDVP